MRKEKALDREIQSMRLRREGKTYDEIASLMNYADRSGAYRAVQNGLKKAVVEEADALRDLITSRTEAIIAEHWPQRATPASAQIILAALRMEMDLYGLNLKREIPQEPVAKVYIGIDPRAALGAPYEAND